MCIAQLACLSHVLGFLRYGHIYCAALIMYLGNGHQSIVQSTVQSRVHSPAFTLTHIRERRPKDCAGVHFVHNARCCSRALTI